MRVRLAVACFCLVPSLSLAQQAGAVVAQGDGSPKVSSELHTSATALVKLSGARQKMLDAVDGAMEQGKQKMLHDYPSYNPLFSEEWAKRMKARTNVDDCFNVIITAYETNLDLSEIKELIQAQKDASQGNPSSVSEPLKAKLSGQVGINIQSQILGGCAQVSSKLGGEAGLEIQKEHPDWVKPNTPIPK